MPKEQPLSSLFKHHIIVRILLSTVKPCEAWHIHSASIVCEGFPIESVARLRVAVQLGPCMKRGSDCSAAPQAIALAFAAVATQVLAHHTLVICGTAYWLDHRDELRKMQSGCLEGLEASLATPLTTLTANAMGQSATWIYPPRQDEMVPMRRY